MATTTLNLENDNVFEVEMTVSTAREFIGVDGMPDEVSTALDEAQGHVHMQKGAESYLVIKITG